MTRGLAALVAVLTLVAAQTAAAAPASSGGSRSSQSHNPVDFTDGAGDSNIAADLTKATVLNTAAGTLGFHLTFGNRTGATAQTDVITVWIDADRNSATGLQGFEFVLVGDEAGAALVRWDGTTFVATGAQSPSGSWAGDGLLLTVAQSDLGGPTAINFFVLTFVDGGTEDQADAMPEAGFLQYTFGSPHIDSVVARFVPTPPRAGRAFSLNRIVLVLETDEQVRPASYRCTARLGTKRLRGTGAGGCRFALPRTARGKRLTVTITATYGNETTNFDPYVFRVR